MFTQNNCHNCPIVGQTEINAWKDDDDAIWNAEEGIYFAQDSMSASSHDHDEDDHHHHHHDDDDF